MKSSEIMDTIKEVPEPRTICKDGFSMSVQNLSTSYAGETSSEVGFPTEKEPLLMPYADDASRPTKTIYPYVPKSLIGEIVSKHGGINPGAMKEHIVNASVRITNLAGDEKLFNGAYHGKCFEQMRGWDRSNAEQGYITSLDRFVDRIEGLAIAIEANQVDLDKKHSPKDKLQSEDLTWRGRGRK